MLVQGAPAAARRIEQDVVERRLGQIRVQVGLGHGGGLGQIFPEKRLAQGSQPVRRGLVADHEAGCADELGQETGLAPRGRAHVEDAGSGWRGQQQGRQHGGTVLDMEIAEPGGQGRAQGQRFPNETAAPAGKRLWLEHKALGGEQRLHPGDGVRLAHQPETTAGLRGRVGLARGSGGTGHGAT